MAEDNKHIEIDLGVPALKRQEKLALIEEASRGNFSKIIELKTSSLRILRIVVLPSPIPIAEREEDVIL